MSRSHHRTKPSDTGRIYQMAVPASRSRSETSNNSASANDAFFGARQPESRPTWSHKAAPWEGQVAQWSSSEVLYLRQPDGAMPQGFLVLQGAERSSRTFLSNFALSFSESSRTWGTKCSLHQLAELSGRHAEAPKAGKSPGSRTKSKVGKI